MEGRDFKFFVSVQYSWLVEASAEIGDVETARRYAAHVLNRARDGERLGEAAASRALAMLAVRADDPTDFRRWMKRADLSARLRGSRREAALNDALSAQIRRAQGDHAAAALAERAAADLAAMGVKLWPGVRPGH